MWRRSTNSRRAAGFTLIELVVVVLLTGILAGTLFMILQGPMKAFLDLERRAALVDIAETALQRMTREIRLALPYSIRISGAAVEFLRTTDGGRYRRQGAGRLKFNVNSDSFTVLSTLAAPGTIDTGADSTDCINSNADCLVVYNIGQPLTAANATSAGVSANAYLGASTAYEGNIATISAAAANSLSFDNSDLAGWNFGTESAQQRFHIVDTPVSYVCSGGEINRHADYAITETQDTTPGGTQSLLVDKVTACSFSLTVPTLTRAGVLAISLQINDATLGQTVTLHQQVHLDNIP
jgi:MSHA biogenesis protein MshO